METVTRFAERQAVAPLMPPNAEAARTLSVTASYVLTEAGRKASLLAGGDGRALQQITLQVPANRLHLVSVDKQGVARLKLRPRYEMDGERGVVRIDAAPVYDEPPTIDELYRAAAKNHELEATYFAARNAARSRRGEADRAFRETVAETFLGDKGQRAVTHPPPTPKRCYLESDKGRLLFDIATDLGRAKDVPAEAHRRFRADLREREERNRQERTTQLALHEEKKRYIAEWVTACGSDEQKLRQADGMLPMDEAIEGIADQAFAAAAHLPLYMHDGATRLQAFLRESTGTSDIVIAPADLTVHSAHAVKATAAQWAVVQQLRSQLPDANVVLREHVLSSKRHNGAGHLTVFGVLVTKKHGPFVLRREYVVEEPEAHD
ncbi:MAG: hypothetical protein AB7P22_08550 [Vicinamibacterales bacterium]